MIFELRFHRNNDLGGRFGSNQPREYRKITGILQRE